ncbi:protein teflon isoform X1 [Drosophila takahashii]|uniref:protein teflon isoform X1 n=1 Tax=Drosophila takahashii TaxID=29030 RepID=UPI003898FDFB
MASFLDMLTGSSSVDLKKCGDVVVSPSDNMLAIYCHFCRDIFTHLPEFLRHLQWAHVDQLHFTKEHNVYSVEELMSDEEEFQSTGGNSSSGGDSGVQAESEESVAFKGFQDDSNDSHEKLALNPPEEKESKVEHHGFKGPRNKTENAGKFLKICDLKSHSIARKSRKQMSSVKSRILQAIKGDLLDPFQMKPSKPSSNLPISEPLQEENIPTHTYQTPPKPAPKPSNLSVRKSTLTQAHVTLALKKTAENLQANTSSTVEKQVVHIAKPANQGEVVKKRKSSPLQIKQVEVLPTLKTLPKTLFKAQHAIKNSVVTSKPEPKRVIKEIVEPQVGKLDKKPSSPALTLKTPLNTLPKTLFKVKDSANTSSNPQQTNKQSIKIVPYENHDQQQRERKILRLNQEQSISLKLNAINTQNKIEISNDSTENKNAKPEKLEVFVQPIIKKGLTSHKNATYNNLYTLLKKIGLPAILDESYEGRIKMDELEKLREKAAKFSKIYSKYDSIWNNRSVKSPEHTSFMVSALTTEVNSAIMCTLTNTEMKRIINLISAWHKDMKYEIFKKTTLPASTEHYLSLFRFLPINFAYFCESCDEVFSSEEVYKKHLLSHNPMLYRCKVCAKCFKHKGFYDKHMRIHLEEEKEKVPS